MSIELPLLSHVKGDSVTVATTDRISISQDRHGQGCKEQTQNMQVCSVVRWLRGAWDCFALHGRWRTDLEGLVGRHVSLEGIIAGTPEDAQVRSNGVLLWQRSDPPG